jgi:hypothetical protein
MDTFFITCGKHNAIKLFFLDLPNILEMVHDHDAHGELICFRSGPRVTLHHWTTPQGSRLTFLSAARLAEKDSSDQQIEQIVVKGKCHASGMYILMYHNSAYISNYFQIFPTYETNTGWKLEAWGSQAISSKLVFFFSFFGGSHAIWGCDLTTLPATLGYLTQGNAAVICDMRWAILC